jgi:hypothetical protein
MGVDALVGTWKLVSWQVLVDGQPRDLFGTHPKGFLILTPAGRAIVLTTAEARRAGDRMEERAALHASMVAYTGRYRVEGDEFITTVDVSWNEQWNGSEQRRRFRIEGERLSIETAPAPSLVFSGRIDQRRIVWEREGP